MFFLSFAYFLICLSVLVNAQMRTILKMCRICPFIYSRSTRFRRFVNWFVCFFVFHVLRWEWGIIFHRWISSRSCFRDLAPLWAMVWTNYGAVFWFDPQRPIWSWFCFASNVFLGPSLMRFCSFHRICCQMAEEIGILIACSSYSPAISLACFPSTNAYFVVHPCHPASAVELLGLTFSIIFCKMCSFSCVVVPTLVLFANLCLN